VGGAVPGTMRAVVLDAPGPPSALAIRELPVPVPSAGWVLIRVRAFGLNRFELYLRLGLSQGVTFPRVPGVEATGGDTAAADPVTAPFEKVRDHAPEDPAFFFEHLSRAVFEAGIWQVVQDK
jgi:NADPH:quinone reductase-like Zn-dependent oxidoreductase